MTRPHNTRKICHLPETVCFKPAGMPIQDLEIIEMRMDELEALRLKDLVGTDQEEAAKQMGVSQPTFHRLISSAHLKVADALINGKVLIIEGGNIVVQPGPGHSRGQCRRRRRSIV